MEFINQTKVNSVLREGLSRFGLFFYLVNPSELRYENVEDVPDFFHMVFPIASLLLLMEIVIKYIQGNSVRLTESLSSLGTHLGFEVGKLLTFYMGPISFTFVHDNFRIVDLPWDSVWVWIFGAVTTDFLNYWIHRFSHEVMFLWSIYHQAHHSSEEYNGTITLRNSFFNYFTYWVLYAPGAIIFPPSHVFSHMMINLVSGIWCHTSLVRKLPAPLEFILVTPSHHRVHHGADRYCIDKNYGGFLIIWDRIFGTFEPERDEPINYGLVDPLQSFNPIEVQVHYIRIMVQKFNSMKGWKHKLAAIFCGPGWYPGSPRLGVIEELPEKRTVKKKYDSHISGNLFLYLAVHYTIIAGIVFILAEFRKMFTVYQLILPCCYIMVSFISLGSLLDGKMTTCNLEFIRCVVLVLWYCLFSGPSNTFLLYFLNSVWIVYMLSSIIFGYIVLSQYSFEMKKIK